MSPPAGECEGLQLIRASVAHTDYTPSQSVTFADNHRWNVLAVQVRRLLFSGGPSKF